MIDTYMDMADTRTPWRVMGHPGPELRMDPSDDPRYYNGALYATVIDCNVAKAKIVLGWQLVTDWSDHSREISQGTKLGDARSRFTASGQRKNKGGKQ